MAVKPETRYIKGVHDKLPRRVDREKQHNVYRGGTWDVWYDGPARDTWVEYKWVDRLPPYLELTNTDKKPCLSKLQQDWGRKRLENGRRIAVVLGTKAGGLIFVGGAWGHAWPRADLEVFLNSKPAVASFIDAVTSLQPGSAAWRKAFESIAYLGPLDAFLGRE